MLPESWIRNSPFEPQCDFTFAALRSSQCKYCVGHDDTSTDYAVKSSLLLLYPHLSSPASCFQREFALSKHFLINMFISPRLAMGQVIAGLFTSGLCPQWRRRSKIR